MSPPSLPSPSPPSPSLPPSSGAPSAGAPAARARRRVVIMGAAGRDFHDFNVVYRGDATHEVVAFTAAQIPNIAGRRYPAALAGALYPDGIPIQPEDDLDSLVRAHEVDLVVLAYSDLSHGEVMHRAARALAAGADFALLGPRATMLRASRPVVSVCAVRTGCGKSPVSRKVARLLAARGLRVAVVRHPMPYGDLARQAVQRFATLDDLARAECTLEEREEYEPHVDAGSVVFAGVDYQRILRAALAEADVIVWDGGNNDLPFFQPDLEIVLLDPHRVGHETAYFPGEVNFLRAHALVIPKIDSAPAGAVAALRAAAARANPAAAVIEARMPVVLDDPSLVRGRRVLVVEDGPTLTHGGMSFGAGHLAAAAAGAAEIVDPRPFAVGSLRETFDHNRHIGRVLPAMGYGPTQIEELAETIRRVPCDAVVVGTPIDLRRALRLDKPACRAHYEIEESGAPTLGDVLDSVPALRGRARTPA